MSAKQVSKKGDYPFHRPSGQTIANNMIIEELPGDKQRISFPLAEKQPPKVDPITFEVILNRTTAIAREMSAAMYSTAFSDIFSETLDFGCGISDHLGRAIGESNEMAVHQCGDQYSLNGYMGAIADEDLKEGDIILCNDSVYGAWHCQELFFIAPIFYEGELMGYSFAVAHHIDMGCATPAYFPSATNLYAEGVRYPPVFFYKEGKLQDDILRIVLNNVRYPFIQYGDIMAEIAAVNTGVKRVQELAAKYGPKIVKDTYVAMQHYAAEFARREIDKIPDGVYEGEDWIDADQPGSKHSFQVRIRLAIEGDHATVDASESDDNAPGFVNSTNGTTCAAILFAAQCFIARFTPHIYGTWSPITYIVRKGSLCSPNVPKVPAGKSTTEGAPCIWNACMKAWSNACPAYGTATYGSLIANLYWGYNPKTGKDFLTIAQSGMGSGGGGRNGFDAWPCSALWTARLTLPNIEIEESRYPILYIRRRVPRDDEKFSGGGAGKFKGSGGCNFEWTPRKGPITCHAITGRYWHPADGLLGGEPSGLVQTQIRDVKTGEVKRVLEPKAASVVVEPGESINMMSSGGGGYGPPLERDPELVARDVREEWYSVEYAESKYGVVVDPETFKVDDAATKKLRDKMAKSAIAVSL